MVIVEHQQIIPYKVGHVAIDPPVILAPMAGHTNRAFRRLVRELGDCGLVTTEVMSSDMLNNKGLRKRSLERFEWDQVEEYPVAVQLFGSDPHTVALAAQIVVDHGATIVDINMGCWVPKIAKKGAGAALMRDVCTAQAVVEAVVEAVHVPVTVKVRSGFEDGVVTAVPFARAAEQVGAKAIAVHARFAGQGHQGAVDWDVIRDVKDTVQGMPVIGNGDIRTPQDAQRMMAITGCDGVMIGRAALSKPWIFGQIQHYLKTGDLLPDPPRHERAAIAFRHAELTMQHTYLPEDVTILQMRKRLAKYDLDEPGSALIRNQLVRVETLQDIEAILSPIIDAG